MIRYVFILFALVLAQPVSAQDNHHKDHQSHHENHNEHNHNKKHDHADHSQNHVNDQTIETVSLIPNENITLALKAGGTPIVAKVLGVVCDFCAKSMDKTFGKRNEVAAVYVDLDTKTLNLILRAEQNIDDETIAKLVKKSGYKVDKIYRGNQVVLGGISETDPS